MLIADYVLFVMNQQRNYQYIKFLQLDEPDDCITTVLTKGAMNLNQMSVLKSASGGTTFASFYGVC